MFCEKSARFGGVADTRANGAPRRRARTNRSAKPCEASAMLKRTSDAASEAVIRPCTPFVGPAFYE